MSNNITISDLRRDPDRLLSQAELCAIIGKSAAWAERARWARIGPAFLKIGRSVVYRAGDVIAWLDDRRVETINERHGAAA